jgi:hypothetical protein
VLLFRYCGCYSLFQVLFQQFKFFLNLYFLVMATSQFIPDIRIGYLYTYWGPLVIRVWTKVEILVYLILETDAVIAIQDINLFAYIFFTDLCINSNNIS